MHVRRAQAMRVTSTMFCPSAMAAERIMFVLCNMAAATSVSFEGEVYAK
jgi:hypothetical protein